MGRRRLVSVTALVIATALAACGGSSGPHARRSTTTTRPRSTTTSTTTRPLAPEGWKQTATAPTGLGLYAVWTGTEYIGGNAGCCLDLGGTGVIAYTPATDSWRSLASWPLPPRIGQVATWTGTEMVVVGGREASSPGGDADTAVPTATAAAYDPAGNTWRTIASLPAPVTWPTYATWTAGRVVVIDPTHTFRYDPRANAWTTGTAPPFQRSGSVVVSTGRQVLVWAGNDDPEPNGRVVVHDDGAAYDPKLDRWSTIPAAPVPARTGSTGVWTGRQMIVWGGHGGGDPSDPGSLAPLGKGATYDPAGRTWRALPPSPLKARSRQVMVWTGHEVLVWGGWIASSADSGFVLDGAAYDPATNAWRSMSPAPPSPPAPLSAYSGFWTGTTAIFMGGSDFNNQGVGPLGLAYSPGR